ncbi:hypothetical protein GCM10010345_68180 [Streptomyces canarius]|uniref:Uncharacterized protein n=1 Tax=Streptomyces canarius TaxID=285453 RepID=A0ABQ3D2V8_9ACTN|nr:hypothetical protein GCM10010345_68180 [Streptomyces canarius]
MHPALLVPGLLVIDGIRTEPHADEPQLTHGKRLPQRPVCQARNAPSPLYVRPEYVSPEGVPHTIG